MSANWEICGQVGAVSKSFPHTEFCGCVEDLSAMLFYLFRWVNPPGSSNLICLCILQRTGVCDVLDESTSFRFVFAKNPLTPLLNNFPPQATYRPILNSVEFD